MRLSTSHLSATLGLCMALTTPAHSNSTIAGYNWTSTEGTDDSVWAIVLNTSGVAYIGGSFTQAGNITANRIARWDGVSWNSLGTGIGNGSYGETIYDLSLLGENLYVGGTFQTAGNITANNLAMWNGTAWNSIGNGVTGEIRALAVSGNDLYIGGSFDSVDGMPAENIAKWDGATWQALGPGVDSAVHDIVTNGTDVFVGGSFSKAGNLTVNGIASWNGTTWHALAGGMAHKAPGEIPEVEALTFHEGQLYAGGYFDIAGEISANSIARWDGTHWHPLGPGLRRSEPPAYRFEPGVVLALTTQGENIYAGGIFECPGTTYGYAIAKWNGRTWRPLGAPVAGLHDPSSFVSQLASYQQSLFVGGSFYQSSTGVISPNFIQVELLPEIDDDQDGASNDWEAQNSYNPSVSQDFSSLDTDGDGDPDLLELFTLSNPNSPASQGGLDFISTQMIGNNRTASFQYYSDAYSRTKVAANYLWTDDLSEGFTANSTRNGVTVSFEDQSVDADGHIIQVNATIIEGNPEKLFLKLFLEPLDEFNP